MNVEELIHSIDIVDFISQYVDLEQRGDEWWGLSCFRDEKTPSFSVRSSPPFFYDFSSGRGGNVLNFVEQYHHCSPREAIEVLKKYAGVTGDIDDSAVRKMSAVSIAKKFMHKQETAKKSKSKVLPDDFMKRYERPADKLAVWEREGISRASLDRFQVAYDMFSDRLVYPIRNVEGEIVNIGGRTVDPMWKDKNLKKYCYFYPWGTVDTLYGFSENIEYMKERGEIIIFEGCKSVLIADTWGMRNCAALLTSHLNSNQMKILIRLGCRVVFALDNDIDVGEDKNINKLKNYVRVEYIKDTDGLLDPKDSPVDKGKDVFGTLYAKRRALRSEL